MKTIKWENLFKIQIPDDWQFSEENGVLSLCNEESGVGVLQLSFAKKNQENIPTIKEAVRLACDFADKKKWKVSDSEIRSYEIHGIPISEFSFSDQDSVFWSVWHLIDSKQIAFGTYNSSIEDADVEIQERNQIIQSFRWLGETH